MDLTEAGNCRTKPLINLFKYYKTVQPQIVRIDLELIHTTTKMSLARNESPYSPEST